MGMGRKFKAAIRLRNNHAQHAMLSNERPDFFGQFAVRVTNFPVIQQVAQLLYRPIQEGLFSFAELRCGCFQQLFPAWPA